MALCRGGVSMRRFCLALLFTGGIWAAPPPCTPPPEVRDLFQSDEWKGLYKLPWAEQSTRRRKLLTEYEKRFPGQPEIATRTIDNARWSDPDAADAVRARYLKAAQDHPDDPFAQAAVGYALFRKDTPQAIEFLRKATAAPGFGWPHLTLAQVYDSDRFADKPKALAELDAYFQACPDSTDGTAQWLLSRFGQAELQRRVAAALRAKLAGESTDKRTLTAYETLWGLEFRTTAPAEHAKVRERVKQDVARLQGLNVKADADWLNLLINGLKQSGDTVGVAAMEKRILTEFPASQKAYFIVGRRWNDENPEPGDPKNQSAWRDWTLRLRAAIREWKARFTEVDYLCQNEFQNYATDPDAPKAETLRAMGAFLAYSERQAPPWANIHAAQMLKDRGWQLERAVELYRKAIPLLELEMKLQTADDTRTTDRVESANDSWNNQKRDFAAGLAKAARLAESPEKGVAWRELVEGDPPKKAHRLSTYWHARAQLAWLEGRKADALAYMQSAMHTRTEPDEWYRGQPNDEVALEAKALWKEMGGTETAWAIWSKPPAAKATEVAEGRWETPKKKMPAFEIAGLDGKTWRLKQFEGKSVLINVWATWCGPCKAELPVVEKLFRQTKDSAEIQVITFNIDEELGLVEPFMKEKGYTFPVLPAMGLVSDMLDGNVGIPQTWLLNPKGEWVQSQVGFDTSEPDWPAMMTKKLKALK
ncbi:MAG: hypothetical protein C0504_06450 [Candidatus Solibacter sp.]|nr:hypothetical protein [Candidatus Solibacter sp.]